MRATDRLGRNLTSQQLQLLEWFSEGLTISEAAERMGIRRDSANRFAKVIRDTLGARTNIHAMVIAIQKGLLDVTPAD